MVVGWIFEAGLRGGLVFAQKFCEGLESAALFPV